MRQLLLLPAAVALLLALPNRSPNPRHAPQQFGYRIVHVYPHDPSAFTQGLEYHQGFLYEGTGLNGHSTLRRERLESGETLTSVSLDPALFGEGITVLNGQVFQLTWLAHLGFVYDQATFQKLRTFSYPGEGWGLANDGHTIYLSDGTPEIRCLNPATMTEERRFRVHDGDKPIKLLNELEWVHGTLYANLWHADRIAQINVHNGDVVGWIDLSGLLPSREGLESEAVLNGIAYDSAGSRLFVTGKLWPKIFEIQLVPR